MSPEIVMILVCHSKKAAPCFLTELALTPRIVMAGYSFGLLLYRRLAILYNQLESFWDVSLNFLMEPVRAIQTHVVTWQRLHLPSYRDQPPDLFIRPFAWMLLPHHLLIPCDHHLPGAGAVRLVLEIHYLARCWILRFLVPTFFAPLKD